MRIAVFSDIHGNTRTWTRFMSMLPTLGVDEFIFCGDIPGMGRGDCAILEDLAEISGLHWVLGNNDRHFLGSLCRELPRLSHTLRSLGSFLRIEREGLKIEIMHGSPESHLHGQIFQEDLPFYEYTGDADIVITGHTHRRMIGLREETLFLNPGSLGYPRDENPPGFALLELPSRSVTFIDVG